MAEILDMDAARQAAQKVNDYNDQKAQERANIFGEVMKEIEAINPALGGFDELSAMLALPEEHFAMIGPVFLQELEKSFNNPNDRLMMAQAMNATGMRAEDAREQYQAIIDEIENQMTMISRQKRDFLKQLLGLTFNAISETEGIAKKVIQVPIELCHPDARIPEYANTDDSGMDVFALNDITIAPGETVLVKTGLKVAIPKGYELQVRPKSGRALKTKMRVANTPGTIDAGYRDEIGVIIDNIDPPIKEITYHMGEDGLVIDSIVHGAAWTIGKGEKFAQLVLCEVPKASFYQVESVGAIENDGRNGGFGSTGVK